MKRTGLLMSSIALAITLSSAFAFSLTQKELTELKEHRTVTIYDQTTKMKIGHYKVRFIVDRIVDRGEVCAADQERWEKEVGTMIAASEAKPFTPWRIHEREQEGIRPIMDRGRKVGSLSFFPAKAFRPATIQEEQDWAQSTAL